MTRVLRLLAALLPLAAAAHAATVETHFSPAERLDAIDAALIDRAKTRLDLAAFVLTDRVVVEALARAAGRGVRVRIVIDPRFAFRAKRGAIGGLQAAGAAVRVAPRGPYMHLKAYCRDGRLLRVGAANFSLSGETRQANDLEILRGPGACTGFDAAFATLWIESTPREAR